MNLWGWWVVFECEVDIKCDEVKGVVLESFFEISNDKECWKDGGWCYFYWFKKVWRWYVVIFEELRILVYFLKVCLFFF